MPADSINLARVKDSPRQYIAIYCNKRFIRLNWQVEAPYGFELLPGDLANPLALNSEGDSKGEVGEKPAGEEGEGKEKEGAKGEEKGEGSISEWKTEVSDEKEGEVGPQDGRDRVFLCVQVRSRKNAAAHSQLYLFI